MIKKLKRLTGLLMALLMMFSIPYTASAETSASPDDYVFINYDTEKFPFRFEIVSYENSGAVLSVISKEGTLSDEDIAISPFEASEEIVNATNGIFSVMPNHEYLFTARYNEEHTSALYACVIKVILDENSVIIMVESRITHEFPEWLTNSQDDEDPGDINPIPPIAIDYDEKEPNNTYQQANSISTTDNDYMKGYINPVSDVDWYGIYFNDPGIANFYITNIPSGCNYNMYIYKDTGTGTAKKQSQNTITTTKLVSMNVEAGYYLIKIASTGGYSASQAYKFRAKLYTPTTIKPATSIKPTSAFVKGSFTSFDTAVKLDFGFFWGTSSPQPQNKKWVGSNNALNNNFNIELMGLSPGTKYYYQAYAENSSLGLMMKGSVESFITSAAPVATTVVFEKPSYSATIPASGSLPVSVSAKVYDQYGDAMAVTPSYSVSKTGVSVNSSGVVTIQSIATAGDTTITASYGGKIGTATLKLTRAISVATTVVFEKPSYSATIPASGSLPVSVSAKVYDQYGAAMSVTPTYSLNSAYTGVSVSGSTVTITSAAAVGTATIRAAYGTISNTVPLNLSNALTVTYNGNNNNGGKAPDNQTFPQGSSVTISGPGTLTRTGHTFIGWNTKSDYSGSNYIAGDTVYGSLDLYARWQYTVTYDANKGTEGSGTVPSPQNALAGKNVTISGVGNLIRPGYTFAGWTENKDGTGAIYTAGQTKVFAGNTTLYAKWTSAATYTVSFVANNGTPAPQTQTITSGGKVTQPTIISRTGFTFGGWYKNSDFSGSQYDFSTAVISSFPLYAKWTLNQSLTISMTQPLFKIVSGSGDNTQTDTKSIALVKGSTNIAAATIDNSILPVELTYSWRFSSGAFSFDSVDKPLTSKEIKIDAPSVAGKYNLTLYIKDTVNGNTIKVAEFDRTVYVTYGYVISPYAIRDGVNVYWLDKAFYKYEPSMKEIVYALNKAIHTMGGTYVYGEQGSGENITEKIVSSVKSRSLLGSCTNASTLLMALTSICGIQKSIIGDPVGIITPRILGCDQFMMKPDQKSFGSHPYTNGINLTKSGLYGLGSENGSWIFGDANHTVTEYDGMIYDPTLGLDSAKETVSKHRF